MTDIKTTRGSIAAVLALLLFVAVSRAQEPAAAVQAGDTITAAELSQPSAAPNGISEVRIVRLSQVKGEVLLDRKTDRGFETAFANLPIAQGQRLQTKEGVAEVEFEDNSTLRITPNSLIEFPALQRGPSGATTTSVKLLKGTLYVSLANTKANQFTVSLGNDTITLTPSSHIRLDTDASKSNLAVFNGSALVANSSGTTTVGKKKSLLLDTTSDANTQAPSVITSKVEHGLFDEWDKTAADYHKLHSVPAAFAGSSYLYGINDLNYYGSFTNAGGCGAMWRPYFTSAAWDPFANGVWAWYPGAGYSWVSPYPWGWTPFHSGSWDYCPAGGGWGWHPGGRWNGLSNQQMAVAPLLHQVHGTAYPRPPHAPAAGSSTLVVVSTKPLAISRQSSADTFVFRNDSAGLGVPRESLGKLSKISQGVAQHGSVSTAVVTPASQAQSGSSVNGSSQGVHSMHVNDPSSAASNSGAAASRSNNQSTNASHGDAGRGYGGASRASSPGSYSGGGSGGGGGGGRSRGSAPAPSSAPSSGGSSSAGAAAGSRR